MQASRTFEPTAPSVSEARRFARAALEEWGVDEVADDVVLLVSELVTNAITHAGTPTTLEVRVEVGGVRLDVEDLHPHRMLRMGTDPSNGVDEHGRGLLLTSALATTWGVEYRPGSKRVWAVVALHETAVAPAEDAGRSLGMASAAIYRAPPRATTGTDLDPLGLRSVALNRLELDDLLSLVVEQARERLSADAAYLLLAHGIEGHLVVRASSGLPVALRGRTVRRNDPGAPSPRAPFLPVSLDDLTRTPVDLLAGQGLRSLVVVPVVFEGRVIGALATASAMVAGFSSDDAALLQRAADWVASAVDRARMRTAELERRGWLGFLAESGVLLAGSLDPEMTVAMTGQILVPRLATWCGVYLDDPSGRTALQHAWHADEGRLGDLRTALEKVGPHDAARSSDPALAGDLTIIPLEVRGRTIGSLVLGRPAGEPLRGEILMIAESIARRAALAIDSAHAHAQLHEIGQALQRGLLPATIPAIRGLDVGVVYEPAGELNAAGGDFYDLFAVGGGRWCFVVGDVCGSGPEAAAVTGMARHTVRALIRSGFPVGTTLERLNEAILDEGERGRFMTLVCGIVEPAGRGYRLCVVCAGHPPPFVVAGGQVHRLGRPQPLLGVLDAVDYLEEEHRLARGDRLVVVTDGVLERREGSAMFDDEGVEAVLVSSEGTSAQGVADRLLRAVDAFSVAPPSDDLAILVLGLGSSS